MSDIALLGTTFQNPVLLAAGTAGFGREVAGVIDLDALGGVVTKAVTPEPRRGHPAPRVAEFRGGMLNAVGLANPGLEVVATRELPQLVARLRRARILVNVPTAEHIAVVDRNALTILATWPVSDARSNYPMALDEANHRVFIGCRKPANVTARSSQVLMKSSSRPGMTR